MHPGSVWLLTLLDGPYAGYSFTWPVPHSAAVVINPNARINVGRAGVWHVYSPGPGDIDQSNRHAGVRMVG